MEEIAWGPALWMWDYLRRSGGRGFFLPLSGGADSSSVAALVASMARIVFLSIKDGNQQTLDRIRIIVKNQNFNPTSFQDIVGEVLVTAYLGTKHSSFETRDRAKRLAEGIGSQHFEPCIDDACTAIANTFQEATGKTPKFVMQGGNYTQDLALQNVQARTRMIISYLMAQLIPWTRGQGGFLLVLGTSNIAEGLRGYMTKYDCSAADINPIGGINKSDLKAFLEYFSKQIKSKVLQNVADAKPSAELRPQDKKAGTMQLDEEEMGMTYAELDQYGKLRKISRDGPLSMFQHLLVQWRDRIDPKTNERLTPYEIADKVKRFFKYYAINRHKMTVLTPSYHAEAYGTDDNRYDLRQFLYDATWQHQFNQIDTIVNKKRQKKNKNDITFSMDQDQSEQIQPLQKKQRQAETEKIDSKNNL